MNRHFLSFEEISKATGGRWLDGQAASDGGVSSVSTDTRKISPGSLFVALFGEKLNGHDFLRQAVEAGAGALCVSDISKVPGEAAAKVPILLVDDTTKAYQRLGNFNRRRMKARIIALTGSCGKTSTKEILRTILAEAFGAGHVLATEGNTNNHVGVPQNLLRLNESHKFAIIEMGTNHPGEIEVLARIAEPELSIITSIGAGHLEFFGDTGGVAKEKSAIFAGTRKGGAAVMPAETPGLPFLEKAAEDLRILKFGEAGEGPAPDISVSYLGGNIGGSSFELRWNRIGLRRKISWPLSGRHQAFNAAAAALAAGECGVPPEKIAEALSGCSLPGMRMRTLESDGITWINDAYNANPTSARAGIDWLAEFADQDKLLAVLGDMLELGCSSVDQHCGVLDHAFEKLPMASFALVGSEMGKAFGKLRQAGAINAVIFPDSAAAAAGIGDLLRGKNMVYLKASRGTALEKIEEAFIRARK